MSKASSFRGTQGSMCLPHLRMVTETVSEASCSLVLRIPDDIQNTKPSTVVPWFASVLQDEQT
jgi:hypothetical protein